MARRTPRPEKRLDIRLEAAFIGAVSVVVALVGWALLARELGAGCGQGCLGVGAQPGQVVLWLCIALSGSLAAAAACVVSAVARLLDAEPGRQDRSAWLSAASADD